MPVVNLSDKNSDGTLLGQTTLDKVGFHGSAPSVQTAMTLMVTAGEATTASTAAALLELHTALVAKGLVA